MVAYLFCLHHRVVPCVILGCWIVDERVAATSLAYRQR